MSESLLSKKSVCIITGPTRGLGWSIAKNLSLTLPEGSLFVLLSRNEALLQKRTEEVSSRKGITAVYEVFDQDSNDQNVYDNILQNCLKKAESLTDTSSFEQAILVNNASYIEPSDFARDLDNVAAISQYMQGNVVACCVLTAKFLQVFSSPMSRTIINISSKAAVSPMNSFMLYCITKAARDMQMQVVGQEEENIRTLNYAPGPLRTDMVETASVATKDPALRKWFCDSLEQNTVLECDESVKKLLKILSQNTFKNGDHIDYYDVQ